MGNFKKLYMRPNLQNSGDVPAESPLSFSPDIWLGGDKPVDDYKTALITDSSYAQASWDKVVVHKDNFIYVRAKNGGDQATTNDITLFYADGAVIQWPSTWINNVIGTDLDPKGKAQIVNLGPGQIGVGDRPFVWRDVPPYHGNVHYCLIAQINDAQNSNPLPDIYHSIDMNNLVVRNLQFGWRNIATIDKGESVEMSYNTMLTVPKDIKDTTQKYLVYLEATDIPVGCKASFICSEPDSKGRKIELEPTEITSNRVILGRGDCILEPGFSGSVTVYLYNPQKKNIPIGAALTFEADYFANYSELEKHNAVELYNESHTNLIANSLKMNIEQGGALLRLGGYSGVIR
jgi:hypothetical protein